MRLRGVVGFRHLGAVTGLGDEFLLRPEVVGQQCLQFLQCPDLVQQLQLAGIPLLKVIVSFDPTPARTGIR